MAGYEELHKSILEGNTDKAKEAVDGFIKEGVNPLNIISDGLVAGMTVVGKKFKVGDMFIPEVLASAGAMKEGIELLKPLLGEKLESISLGKVVIGTVQGDLHNIGKKIVAMILESEGFTVVDLGIDVPTEKFIEVVEQEKPKILGLSALLTTTMPRMKDIIEELKQKNLKSTVKVLIGGAPITQGFADSIGADGYAADAVTAADKAKQLIGKA